MTITLKARVFALVSVLVVLSMSALSYSLLANLRDRLEADFESRGAIIASYFAADSVEGVIIEDQDGLQQVVQRLFEIEDIVYAAIYDAEGTRIVGRTRIVAEEGGVGGSPQQITRTETAQVLAGPNHNVPVLDFRTPVTDEDGTYIGAVQIGLNLESIDVEVHKLVTRSVVLLAVFVVLGFAGSLLVANSIANPIKALTRVFALIAGGDLDHEIDTSRKDELGSLSSNFAALRDSIRHKLQLLEEEALVRKRAEQELEQHRDHLEDLVRERTTELAATNAELVAEVAERQKTQEHLRQSLEELARHNHAMIGREKRIIELKAEINNLRGELGRAPAFGNGETGPDADDPPTAAAEAPMLDSSERLEKTRGLQKLLDSYCATVGIAAAVVDLQGEILVQARWQRICTAFHRQHPATCRRCLESDTTLANQMRAGQPYALYTCRNGLTDVAAPIIVNGQHVANLFVGQCLLGPPDIAFFRQQAAEHGFPEEEYLEALAAVPIVDQHTLEGILDFLSQLAIELGAMEFAQAGLTRANAALSDSRAALLSMMEDLIEARQNAEEYAREAEVANRFKSAFLANMSHEIRTPMTAILGFAGMLLEGSNRANAPESTEAAQAILRNGEYLLDIINDILDLSKVEAGKMTVERIACEPCVLIAEVASLMKVKAERAGLSFDVDYVGAIPKTIHTDPTRLRQVLINLISNAIKFTETGSVRLVTQLTGAGDDTHLQFDVIDTGLGLTAEQAARLFQPFTQADSSTTRKFGGTGLGLTISKKFAELLGGNVTLVETRLGAGSRFRLTVRTGPLDGTTLIDDPLSATVVATATTPAPADDRDQTDLHDCRILLAEDGPDNQRLISILLQKVGATVTIQENGKLAVDAALAARDAAQPFDVILMDMQMPVMDGREATERLRRAGYTGPIIALTANAMQGDREQCIALGCDDYCAKPINRQTLISTIRRHVRTVSATS